MEWTKETPTVEGVYWYWDGPPTEMALIAELRDQTGEGVELDETWHGRRWPSELDGYWYGPIEPPAVPQEATP